MNEFGDVQLQLELSEMSSVIKSILPQVIKGAVSRNSVKLGSYKMPVELRETCKYPLKSLKKG